MIPEVLVGIIALASISTISIDALKKILDESLANKKIKLTANEKLSLVAEIMEKSEEIRAGETPEEASRLTREVVEKQITILEKERNRLMPIAIREHWTALAMAIIAGIVFLGAVILLILGTTQQATISIVASAIPGFLSHTFFSRENNIEKRIEKLSSDLRESEKIRERLDLFEKVLKVVPNQYHDKLISEFIKQFFEISLKNAKIAG